MSTLKRKTTARDQIVLKQKNLKCILGEKELYIFYEFYLI